MKHAKARIYQPNIKLPAEWTTTAGTDIIISELGKAQERQGFEHLLLPPGKVGLDDYDRAHSQGPGTGYESARGILYAPREVNRKLQNAGVEMLLRQMIAMASRENVELRLVTETQAHPGTRLLRRIVYLVQSWQGSRCRIEWEAEISVSNDTANPRVDIAAAPGGRWDEYRR